MARTRQKAKLRKAKREEEERKVAERSQAPVDASAATTRAVAEVEEAQHEAALEAQEAVRAAEVAGTPEAALVPVPESVPVKARTRQRREAEIKQKTAKPAARPARKAERRPRGRLLSFFVQVWAELRRVQWPDRNQVTQATSVVVVFCLVAGSYLAIWDFVFSKLVKLIL